MYVLNPSYSLIALLTDASVDPLEPAGKKKKKKKTETRTLRLLKKANGKYVPKTCCAKKQCWKHLPVEYCQKIRDEVWKDASLNSHQHRARILFARDTSLMFGINRDIQPCTAFVNHMFGISKTFLLYTGTHKQLNLRSEEKTNTLLVWFDRLKEVCCPMPDKGSGGIGGRPHCTEWQVFFPTRKSVYRQYMVDSVDRPDVWCPVSSSWFMSVWRKMLNNFKLRKYLRFAKCAVCIDFREVSPTVLM